MVELGVGLAGDAIQQPGRCEKAETRGHRTGSTKTGGAVEPHRAVACRFLLTYLAVRGGIGQLFQRLYSFYAEAPFRVSGKTVFPAQHITDLGQ